MIHSTFRYLHPHAPRSKPAFRCPTHRNIRRFVASAESEEVDGVDSIAGPHQHRNVLAEVTDAGAESVDQEYRRSVFRAWAEQKNCGDAPGLRVLE